MSLKNKKLGIMKEILNIINTIRENKADEHLLKINNSTKLREDCGFDSLDLAELTVRVESEFGIDIFADGIVSTIGEILGKIKK